MSTAFRIMLFMVLVVAPIKATNPRKLDETTNPIGSPNDEIKCGSCPCGTTCYSSPPPPKPSPPPASPPPPPASPSPPPPPPKKQPQTPGLNCPPPPYSGGGGGGGGGGGSGYAPPDYIYISGPPGDLYPVVQSVSAGRWVAPSLLVVSGVLLGILIFW